MDTEASRKPLARIITPPKSLPRLVDMIEEQLKGMADSYEALTATLSTATVTPEAIDQFHGA